MVLFLSNKESTPRGLLALVANAGTFRAGVPTLGTQAAREEKRRHRQ